MLLGMQLTTAFADADGDVEGCDLNPDVGIHIDGMVGKGKQSCGIPMILQILILVFTLVNL